ncbi:glycosyltransferase [Puteibacter caeruleilacunae]|nr:glycosyltransferase [Puteibacter caeruleilacunae]
MRGEKARSVSGNDVMIIVPVYNEEENLDRVGHDLSEFIKKARFGYQVLFVNDGSSDRSQGMIEDLCEEHQKFEYLELHRNLGLSAAIKAGIDYADTPFVGYIDSDLQTSPYDFDLLMDYAGDYDMVTGIRANRKDSFVKNLSSKIANSIRRAVTHDGMEDTGCPLKIIRSDYAKRIPFFNGMHRFLPALIQLQEGRVKQVPVTHYPRIAGEAKYHLWNRLIGPLFDLFGYRWMKKRYINYKIKSQG